MGISVEGANKSFGDFQALDDVSIEVPDGSLTALLGPSGSGKSTLLRAIAGLEELDSGRVLIDGEDVSRKPTQKREVGFVFQHYAAFKHMTVYENVGFGLKIRKWKKDAIRERVDELLNLVQLPGLADRYPSQLSGGQRQRMALARALAVQPQVLLLDEPFGALDAKVRKDLRTWLRNLHEEMNVTTIFVTHDQEEAMDVAGQLVVMNQGRVEQSGTANDLYEKPANEFVMSFVGEVNRLGDSYVRPHDIEIVGDRDENDRGGDGPADRRPRFRDPRRARPRRRQRGLGPAHPPRAAATGTARGADRLPAPGPRQELQRFATAQPPWGLDSPGVHGRRRRGSIRSRLKRRRAGCTFCRVAPRPIRRGSAIFADPSAGRLDLELQPGKLTPEAERDAAALGWRPR